MADRFLPLQPALKPAAICGGEDGFFLRFTHM